MWNLGGSWTNRWSPNGTIWRWIHSNLGKHIEGMTGACQGLWSVFQKSFSCNLAEGAHLCWKPPPRLSQTTYILDMLQKLCSSHHLWFDTKSPNMYSAVQGPMVGVVLLLPEKKRRYFISFMDWSSWHHWTLRFGYWEKMIVLYHSIKTLLRVNVLN